MSRKTVRFGAFFVTILYACTAYGGTPFYDNDTPQITKHRRCAAMGIGLIEYAEQTREDFELLARKSGVEPFKGKSRSERLLTNLYVMSYWNLIAAVVEDKGLTDLDFDDEKLLLHLSYEQGFAGLLVLGELIEEYSLSESSSKFEVFARNFIRITATSCRSLAESRLDKSSYYWAELSDKTVVGINDLIKKWKENQPLSFELPN